MSKRKKIEAVLAGGILAYALANVFIAVVEKRTPGRWDRALRRLSR